MSISNWAEVARRHRRLVILCCLLITFTGVALVLNQPEGTSLGLLGFPLAVGGSALLTWIVWPSERQVPETRPSLASRIIQRMSLDGKLVRGFPMFGLAILVAVVLYNLKLSATPAFQTEDIIAILAALVLLGYGFVPSRFARQRDFFLAFVIALNAILVVPLLVARAWQANFERSVDFYSWVALAPQASAVLSLLGVANSVHTVTGATAPGLTFTPERVGVPVTVVITTACSGIYSFGIFASAFLAFVLTEFERLAKRVWLLLGLGLLSSYIANVFRMVIIVLVGYYTDTAETDLQNMLIAHSYAGWLIFLGWITLFWSLLLKVLPIKSQSLVPENQIRAPTLRHESICRACGNVLSPTVPGVRCECGLYYHKSCLDSAGRCVVCGRHGTKADLRSPEMRGP